MLSYIKLNNFKSFKDIILDLHMKGGAPKSTAFIYGENASGKTNLMQAVSFLGKTFRTLRMQSENSRMDKAQINKLLDQAAGLPDGGDVINKLINTFIFTLKDIVNESITVGCTDPMTIEIGFYLKESDGKYKITFDDGRVVFEELRYLIKERSMPMFTISDNKVYLSTSVFLDTAYRRELENSISKYWGKHTFMSILFNEFHSKNDEYTLKRMNPNLLVVLKWMRNIAIMSNEKLPNPWNLALTYDFMDNLESGFIEKENVSKLDLLEDILDSFFTSLYTDVKKVFYSKQQNMNKVKYQLIFKKQIDGKIMELPFYLESTGTVKLLEILPYIMNVLTGSTVLIDELDSGIHDLLISEMIKYLMESMEETHKGQLIVTTHNTLLMRQLPKENVYIISMDANGQKSINCINDYRFRTQKTNSIQSKYLNGDYSGVPYMGYMDFAEMSEKVNDLSDEGYDS